MQESSGPKLHPSDEDESNFFGEFLCKSQPERGAQVQKKGRNFEHFRSSTNYRRGHVGNSTRLPNTSTTNRRERCHLIFCLEVPRFNVASASCFCPFLPLAGPSFLHIQFRTRRHTNSVNSNLAHTKSAKRAFSVPQKGRKRDSQCATPTNFAAKLKENWGPFWPLLLRPLATNQKQ